MSEVDKKKTSPMKYILFGCIGTLLLLLGGCGILSIAGLVGVSHVASEVQKQMDQDEAKSIKLTQFKNLKTGMPYKRVVEILGSEGSPTADSQLAGFKTEGYSWSNLNGSNIQCLFQNGKLVQKSQMGLKD